MKRCLCLLVVGLSLLLGLQAAQAATNAVGTARHLHRTKVRHPADACRQATQPPSDESRAATQPPSSQVVVSAEGDAVEAQPPAVLIEAMIVQITLNKDTRSGVDFARVAPAGATQTTDGEKAATGFSLVPVSIAGSESASEREKNVNGMSLAWLGGSTAALVQALAPFGETKVLASPRLLVLNKQRAEIQLGDRLGYRDPTTQEEKFLDLGTILRLRPFVSPDGTIRLEAHLEHTTGRLDEQGVPQTHSAMFTTNLAMQDGATVVVGGLIMTELTQASEGSLPLSSSPCVDDSSCTKVESVTDKQVILLLTSRIYPQPTAAMAAAPKPLY